MIRILMCPDKSSEMIKNSIADDTHDVICLSWWLPTPRFCWHTEWQWFFYYC